MRRLAAFLSAPQLPTILPKEASRHDSSRHTSSW